MSGRWAIHVPYRDPAARLDLGELHDMAAELGSDDAAVTRELAQLAVTEFEGCKTYGDLVARVRSTSEADRRVLLDRLRERAGLKSASDIEAAERAAAAEDTARRRRRDLARRTEEQQPHPVLTAGGAIVLVDPVEAERERLDDEQREKAARERREARAHNADQQAERNRTREARFEAELPAAFRP